MMKQKMFKEQEQQENGPCERVGDVAHGRDVKEHPRQVVVICPHALHQGFSHNGGGSVFVERYLRDHNIKKLLFVGLTQHGYHHISPGHQSALLHHREPHERARGPFEGGIRLVLILFGLVFVQAEEVAVHAG
jgi:hypothetical protein